MSRSSDFHDGQRHWWLRKITDAILRELEEMGVIYEGASQEVVFVDGKEDLDDKFEFNVGVKLYSYASLIRISIDTFRLGAPDWGEWYHNITTDGEEHIGPVHVRIDGVGEWDFFAHLTKQGVKFSM